MGRLAEESKARRSGVAARLAATGSGNEAWVSVKGSRAVDGAKAITARIGAMGLVVEAGRARG